MRTGIWISVPADQPPLPKCTSDANARLSPVDPEFTFNYPVPSSGYSNASFVYPGLAPIEPNTSLIDSESPYTDIGPSPPFDTPTPTFTIQPSSEAGTAPGSLLSSTHRHVLRGRISKPPARRSTCETCRKLHIRCIASTEGGGCIKCIKKGVPCTFIDRAAYGSKVKSNQ